MSANKDSTITYNPELNKLSETNLFPEKVAKAKAFLKKPPIPKHLFQDKPQETVIEIPTSDILKEHKQLTATKYADLASVSTCTARRHLAKFVSKGFAKREGKGANTHYLWVEVF
ncbi:MAG TPA: hypothetical protein DCE41_33715 [Cytophagales bacterium]|nr:hypothetical protein [Cytophagales bacterium]HAA19309.1 hypothetical protein [Cytophagales bacterium]HAP60087.1 hypothetical protein [Cytophagales bacterium]